MRRERILLLLGLWVAVLPYLGFPYFWKNIFLTISGMALVYLSILYYYETEKNGDRKTKTFENFSENGFSSHE